MTDHPPIVDRPASIGDLRGGGEVRAAIDLGTNSFHLLVARVQADGSFDLLTKEKEVVRLGSGAGTLRSIAPDAMERGLDALRRFRRIADGYGATIDAVGTSALREAGNRDDFVRRALAETGIVVDVISGTEEARLIHLGVIQTLPVFDDRILVVDIGGGSTELVVGEGTDVLLARSLKLGAIRLTDRFFPSGRVAPEAVTDCRRYVRSFLAPAVADVRMQTPVRVVGTSGTIVNLARMIAAAEGRDASAVAGGDTFDREQLRRIVAEIVGRRTAGQRARMPGLDERRSDIIAAGALLLDEIVSQLDVDEMTVSDAALREGVLVHRAARRDAPGMAERLRDIRQRSVVRMAEAFHEDLSHIRRATELTLQLFDRLRPEHGLGDTERDLLEAAALLHNVGLFVSHAAHHRHSYYVIRNTDQLDGFTDHDIELVAQIARYHRKSHPKPSHAEFEALPPADQRLVRLLAGMLRVGIALDRSRRGVISSVDVEPGDGALVIVAHHAREVDVSLEQYTGEDRVSLLAAALDTEIGLRFVTD